jgi:hypothetical protein
LYRKRCQTEIDYLLGILPTKEMVINQVEAIIFDLSEFEETNPNQDFGEYYQC